MSYVPTNWTNGDLITAEKLNKIENGLGSVDSCVFQIPCEDSSHESLGKTWQEIYNAATSGKLCYVTYPVPAAIGTGIYVDLVASVFTNGTYYYVVIAELSDQSTIELRTDSPNGYPMRVHE